MPGMPLLDFLPCQRFVQPNCLFTMPVMAIAKSGYCNLCACFRSQRPALIAQASQDDTSHHSMCCCSGALSHSGMCILVSLQHT